MMDAELKARMERRQAAGFYPTTQYDERPETVHKVWLLTYWFGRGPIYTYEGSKLPRRISRAWLVSVHPPYYDGVGIGIRLRNTTLRFGVCYPRGRIFADPLDESIEDIADGLRTVAPSVAPLEDEWETVESVVTEDELRARYPGSSDDIDATMARLANPKPSTQMDPRWDEEIVQEEA